jgi:hypothetical protein
MRSLLSFLVLYPVLYSSFIGGKWEERVPRVPAPAPAPACTVSVGYLYCHEILKYEVKKYEVTKKPTIGCRQSLYWYGTVGDEHGRGL